MSQKNMFLKKLLLVGLPCLGMLTFQVFASSELDRELQKGIPGHISTHHPGIFVPGFRDDEKQKVYNDFEKKYMEMKRQVGSCLMLIIEARSYPPGKLPIALEMELDDLLATILKITGIDLTRSVDYSQVFKALREKYDQALIRIIETVESPHIPSPKESTKSAAKARGLLN